MTFSKLSHGHHDISITMIKICDKAILEPLSIIYKNCIDTGIFSDSWKKSNIVPLHGKGDKQLLENHRPVSLLAVLGKVFEKTLFNNIFEYLQIWFMWIPASLISLWSLCII